MKNRIAAVGFFVLEFFAIKAQQYNVSSSPCDPLTYQNFPWYLGGNQTLMSAMAGGDPGDPRMPDVPDLDIGTCDNYDFILKSNNFQSIWVKPSGNIGINSRNPGAALEVAQPGTNSSFGLKIYGNNSGDIESRTGLRMLWNTGAAF